MKWYWWIGGALLAGLGVWYYLDERKKVREQMERVREAKAVKKFSTLNNTEDGTVRNEPEKINPAGNQRETSPEA
jgi:hypothetical protein